MKLSLKYKILLVICFFLTLLTLITVFGYRYIKLFSSESRAILEDNYQSVEYAADLQKKLRVIHNYNMLSILRSADGDDKLFKTTAFYNRSVLLFKGTIKAARKNVTEIRETALLEDLEKEYNNYLIAFKKTFNASAQQSLSANVNLSIDEFIPSYQKILGYIDELHSINMDAIAQKNKAIQETGEQVGFYLGLVGIVGILAGASLLFFLPGYMANPLIELNQKIQEIIAENYDQKLELKYHSQDEVGELATSFNSMASKLHQFSDSNLAQIWNEKKRTEAVIRILNKAIIVLDENRKILHVNKSAQQLIGKNELELVGKFVAMVADENENFRHLTNQLILPTMENELKENKKSEVVYINVDGESISYRTELQEIRNKSTAKTTEKHLGYVIVAEKATSL